MSTNEMTMRMYHEAVLAIPNIPDEVRAKATAELTKLNEANARRLSKPSKTALANAPIKESICGLLAERGAMISADIATALEISTSKASALCGQLVTEGKLTATEVKVKGSSGKRTVKQYALAENDTVNEVDE